MELIAWLALALIAGILYFEWAKRRAIADKMRRYAQMSEPIIEFSRHPLDFEVQQRVDEHIEWLAASGNTWHKEGKRIVFVLHYNAVANDGKSGHIGAFLSWNHYLISVGDFTRRVVNEFAGDIQAHDSDAYVKWHLKQQK
jgi:hypothetical protein